MATIVGGKGDWFEKRGLSHGKGFGRGSNVKALTKSV